MLYVFFIGAPLANTVEISKVFQELVNPPLVPEHTQVAKGPPKIVQIKMIIEEKEIEIAPEVYIHALTFNGSVPGPLIVVHQDDYVELTLVNPSSNSMMHNIDFHASTGAMGGGELTKVSPGEEVVLRFKATKAGVFVYHCAPGGPMVPWHVVHGMNGAIMVLPRDGLKDDKGNAINYSKVFYIGEQDFYIPKDINGKYKRYNTPIEGYVEELEVMKTLQPSHIVFNGKVGSLTGENALKANVGDTVMIIHEQANRQSYPHLIGGHGDGLCDSSNSSHRDVKFFISCYREQLSIKPY